MARNDLNFSEAVEFLAMLVPTTPIPKTSKIDAKLSSIQAQAFNIVEYTQEVKEDDLFPGIVYCDYVMICIGMIEDTIEDLRRE
jgi:hypothetical protein